MYPGVGGVWMHGCLTLFSIFYRTDKKKKGGEFYIFSPNYEKWAAKIAKYSKFPKKKGEGPKLNN